jgi:hypothetical protein
VHNYSGILNQAVLRSLLQPTSPPYPLSPISLQPRNHQPTLAPENFIYIGAKRSRSCAPPVHSFMWIAWGWQDKLRRCSTRCRRLGSWSRRCRPRQRSMRTPGKVQRRMLLRRRSHWLGEGWRRRCQTCPRLYGQFGILRVCALSQTLQEGMGFKTYRRAGGKCSQIQVASSCDASGAGADCR